jgi:hypothetical protein
MPTHQDETLPQRYAREHQNYLKLCGSMTAEQVADLQLQLNNALAREQALQQLLTAADERVDVLELDKARIDWLAEQPVDTLYLDDGRIIDIAGRVDLRDAIDAAMAAPPTRLDD